MPVDRLEAKRIGDWAKDALVLIGKSTYDRDVLRSAQVDSARRLREQLSEAYFNGGFDISPSLRSGEVDSMSGATARSATDVRS